METLHDITVWEVSFIILFVYFTHFIIILHVQYDTTFDSILGKSLPS